MAARKRTTDDDFGDVSLSPLRDGREERAGLAQDDNDVNEGIKTYLLTIAHMQQGIEEGISDTAVQNFLIAMANVFGTNLVQQADIEVNNITPAGRKYFIANRDKLTELLDDTKTLIKEVANFRRNTEPSAETSTATNNAMWGQVKAYETKLFTLSLGEKVKIAISTILGAIVGAIACAMGGSLMGPAGAVVGGLAGLAIGGVAGWQVSKAVLFKMDPLRQAAKNSFIEAFNEEIAAAIEAKQNYRPGSVSKDGQFA